MSVDSTDTDYIRFNELTKKFGPVVALDSVSFSVNRNEVLALMGDNGAGKSTLIKILSGVLQPTTGSIYIEGEEVSFSTHRKAQRAGIETVYQELAISPNRSITENIFLGKERIQSGGVGGLLRLVDDDSMEERAVEILDRLDLDNVDPRKSAGDLSGGQQQAVAIGRALELDPEILIMDEPTSALSVEASERILALIKELKKEDLTIILIDHNIEEVFEVADRAAVLASGEYMGTHSVDNISKQRLIQLMMGMDAE
jgi:ABC-type sugar transport system ATPase subunit